MGLISTSNFFVRKVPDTLILSIKKIKEFDTFIETGSFLGETSYWAEKYFKNVISFEASEKYFKNLTSSEKIKFICGDSSKELSNFLVDNSIIYLDAHYSGGITHKSYPLLSELTQINDSQLHNLVIIVDDARFCLSKWNGESYGYVMDILELMSNSKSRYICIFEDMIIAVPKDLEPTIDNWVKEISAKYWYSFKYRNSLSKKIKSNISRVINNLFK